MRIDRDGKIYYSWKDYQIDFNDIDAFMFDHVVGIYRGSLGMAAHVSNCFSVPMSIIGFQTRDGKDKEPYWMHNALEENNPDTDGQTIMVVDDIYDTGNTMRKVMNFIIKERTRPSAYPEVIGHCLFGKKNEDKVSYSQYHDGSWIVFPWETLDESI